MTKQILLPAAAVLLAALSASELFGRGGGGGGSGGFHGGGGGGGYRPAASPSFNRSPSMSRAAPAAVSRPGAYPGGGAATRPAAPGAASRPAAGRTPATTYPGNVARTGPGAARPTQGELQHFLNMPGEAGARPATAAKAAPAAAGAAHGFVAGKGPGGGTVVAGGSVHGVRGPGTNAAVRAGHAADVRRNFNGYHSYWTPRWYARYPGAWAAAGIAAAAWWATPAWGSCYGWCGAYAEPVTYDYGANVVYEGDTVYYGDKPVATAGQYYDQAAQLAGTAAEETPNEEWLPLGTFAVVADDQTKTDKVLQLAVNKEGVVRGNLHDAVADKVVPIEGAVNKQTQRVAFRPAGSSSVVAECGLWNLTQDTLTVLLHLDKDRTEQRTLVRLAQPDPQDDGGEQPQG